MCVCNGTGGINLEHSWGISFNPCPSSDCDFDRDKALKEQNATIDKIIREINSRRNLV